MELQDCKLHQKRTKIVFGEGNPKAKIVFVGEGPGENEDKTGRPFVGQAGQLLDKMIAAMGYTRDDVYITNVVKCRPPDNRVPEADEVAMCSKYMRQEIRAIEPDIVIPLGLSASKAVLRMPATTKMGDIRGKFYPLYETNFDPPTLVMPTYHPAALLRNDNLKAPTWEDLQKIMSYLKRTE
jgi:uracil-DNA glycosylase family 4